MKNGNSLNPKQEQAALMLAAGSTVTDAAAAVGVDRATVSQWQNIPEFEALVNRERQAARAAAHGKLILLAQKAVARLEGLLDSKNERIALSAALGILANAEAAEIGPASAESIHSRNRLEALTDF